MNTLDNDDYRCVYDKKGNLTAVYENNILSKRYTYDEQSRLIREDNLYYDTTFTYKYNEYGKISERNHYKYTLTTPTEILLSNHYEYSKSEPHQLIAFNNENFEYDNDGNAIIFRDAKLKWSKNNKLLAIDNCSTYEYNDQNMRIRKTTSYETTRYYLNDNKLSFQENDDIIIFIYNCGEVCGFSYRSYNASQDFVYKKNFRGDIVGIYDSNNELICKYIYDAWGNHKILIKHNNEYLDISLIAPNNKDFNFAFIAGINPYRYHGYYFDIETGLYYNNGNYYDAELGVYLNK